MRRIAIAATGLALLAALAGCTPTPAPTATSTHSTSAVAPSQTASSAAPTPSSTPASSDTVAPVTSSTPAPTAPSGKARAIPRITDASWDASAREIDVQGLVTNTVDASGTCIATASKGGTSVRATGAAIQGASTLQCTPIAISGTGLTAGVWSVVLTYESAKVEGSSAATKVTIR